MLVVEEAGGRWTNLDGGRSLEGRTVLATNGHLHDELLARLREGDVMRPRITLITLGVDDLERSLRFYRNGLGWRSDGIVGTEFEHGAVAFFQLDGGLGLALWERPNIAWDTGCLWAPEPERGDAGPQRAKPGGGRDRAVGVRCGGRDDRQTCRTDVLRGYAGYAADPDGHLWEIAFNPDLLPPD